MEQFKNIFQSQNNLNGDPMFKKAESIWKMLDDMAKNDKEVTIIRDIINLFKKI